MDLGLSNSTAVISGGSKGMGRAAAERLAADGARVAILARTKPALDDTVATLRELGSPDAVGIVTDLTSRADVDQAFAEIAERLTGGCTADHVAGVFAPERHAGFVGDPYAICCVDCDGGL